MSKPRPEQKPELKTKTSMIDKIIGIWDKCQGNKIKQGALILLLLLAVAAIIVFVYFHREAIIVVCLIIAYVIYKYYEWRKRLEAQRQQLEIQRQQWFNTLIEDTLYILRKALTGLEHLFGIPTTEDKGLEGVIDRYFKDGVLYFDVFYLRLPNLPDLTAAECEQLRKILNSAIKRVIEHLLRKNLMPIWVYVWNVQTEDGKLILSVIPLINDKARAKAEEHHRWAEKREKIGKTETGKTKVSNDKELTDDEV